MLEQTTVEIGSYGMIWEDNMVAMVYGCSISYQVKFMLLMLFCARGGLWIRSLVFFDENL